MHILRISWFVAVLVVGRWLPAAAVTVLCVVVHLRMAPRPLCVLGTILSWDARWPASFASAGRGRGLNRRESGSGFGYIFDGVLHGFVEILEVVVDLLAIPPGPPQTSPSVQNDICGIQFELLYGLVAPLLFLCTFHQLRHHPIHQPASDSAVLFVSAAVELVTDGLDSFAVYRLAPPHLPWGAFVAASDVGLLGLLALLVLQPLIRSPSKLTRGGRHWCG
mmetsp:Transcript_7927/g.10723  ORF Transcript_7927/g.10723 Transcript_7927/m.10723 type:complete len:221 (+) Transcript_7927:417-1079(+)